MSGFAAIIRFDGAPAEISMLARMLDAIAYRGPDNRQEWAGGQAAIGHLMLHTTAESLSDVQPLANEEASLVLAMDGWLANPGELRAELLARGARIRTRSDAELVLRAFETWGDECPLHIDGEYAFIVWDSARREVFCAKDPVGMRPLHYHWDGKRLLVASDIAGIMAAGDFESRPNLGMIAEHLADLWFTPDETLWGNVLRLSPAHRMRAKPGDMRVDRYWVPAYVPSICYSSDEEYHEHYRELLTDVVRRASRTHRPLACEVSGGLDSSAILAVAHRLQIDGALQAPGLQAYTVTFGPNADPSIDEVQFARAVAMHLDIGVKEVPPFLPSLDWFADRAKADRDMPPYPHSAAGLAMGHALLSDGCRVDLNGEGGDLFVSAPPYYFSEYIAKGNWSALARTLREEQSDLGNRETLRRVVQFGLRPLIPRELRRLRQKLTKLSLPAARGVKLLSGTLKKSLIERKAAAVVPGWIADLDPHRRLMMMRLDDAFTSCMMDHMSRSAARLGFERRSPFFSRKIVEFAFAAPSQQFTRGQQTKRFHRMAMVEHLPRAVLDRTTKANGNAAFAVQLDKIDADKLKPLLELGIDCVDPEGLQQLLEQDRNLPVTHRAVYELWATFGCCTLFADRFANEASYDQAS